MNQSVSQESTSSIFSSKRWSLFSSGNYPYVCARVRAKRALIFPQDVYAKLLMMDTHEITRFLGESHYKKEITELGLTYSGFELTELALNRNLAEVYQQILGFCEGDLLTMLTAYLQREDIFNIITILRGKSYNAKTEDITRSIRSAGKYPESYWKSIIEKSNTVEETIDNLRENDYYKTLKEMKNEWGIHPAECENKLQQQYYKILLNSISARSEANQLFLEFIRREIDLVNIKTLLMTKFENVELTNITSMLLNGGNLTEKNIQKLTNSKYFKEFLEELQRAPEYSKIRDKISTIEQTGSLSHVIRALEKQHLTQATKSSYLHPLSILPILDYLIRKKIEVENLRILARGKEKKLPELVMKEMLVM